MVINTITLYRYLVALNLRFRFYVSIAEFLHCRKLVRTIEKTSLAAVGFVSECAASRKEKAMIRDVKTA